MRDQGSTSVESVNSEVQSRGKANPKDVRDHHDRGGLACASKEKGRDEDGYQESKYLDKGPARSAKPKENNRPSCVERDLNKVRPQCWPNWLPHSSCGPK